MWEYDILFIIHTNKCTTYIFILFFLSFNLLIGWQLSIWNRCKPFFSLLYNCHLLCFWRLALRIVVAVFLHLFSKYCSFKDVYYKLVMPNYIPYPRVASFLLFLKVIFLLSPFERLHHSLFYLSMWVCQFSSIGPLPRWRIGERSLDIEVNAEIKYTKRT